MCLLPRHPRYQMSTLICRISARRSAPIFGRPPRERDFQRQYLFVPCLLNPLTALNLPAISPLGDDQI